MVTGLEQFFSLVLGRFGFGVSFYLFVSSQEYFCLA
jgi:hypothetical protein